CTCRWPVKATETCAACKRETNSEALLTEPPLSLTQGQAEHYAADIRDFWATVAAGDANFDYSHLPDTVQHYFHRYNAVNAEGKAHFIDNNATLTLGSAQRLNTQGL
ncbi:MAG: hypothetical protein AAGL17_17310, partial [Cyanobacteria bacterium J06576_12]